MGKIGMQLSRFFSPAGHPSLPPPPPPVGDHPDDVRLTVNIGGRLPEIARGMGLVALILEQERLDLDTQMPRWAEIQQCLTRSVLARNREMGLHTPMPIPGMPVPPPPPAPLDDDDEPPVTEPDAPPPTHHRRRLDL